MRLPTALGLVSALALAVAGANAVADDDHGRDSDFHHVHTATPIKHLVVIFQENVSFDHYFGTYPNAHEPRWRNAVHGEEAHAESQQPRQPARRQQSFRAARGRRSSQQQSQQQSHSRHRPTTPRPTAPARRIRSACRPSQALTADQGHNESPEESAYDNGKMDGFPAFVGTAGPPPAGIGTKALVMGYFDGNTVTAMWNYAQHFALNDNNYTTQFGPSTPGAINLISGQTNGFAATMNVLGYLQQSAAFHARSVRRCRAPRQQHHRDRRRRSAWGRLLQSRPSIR